MSLFRLSEKASLFLLCVVIVFSVDRLRFSVDWFTASQVYWFTASQVYWVTGLQVYRVTGLQVYCFADLLLRDSCRCFRAKPRFFLEGAGPSTRLFYKRVDLGGPSIVGTLRSFACLLRLLLFACNFLSSCAAILCLSSYP